MPATGLYPTQGLQNFIDETSNLLVANSSMSAGQLGGSGQFRSAVVGRAAIVDISQNLRPQMGIERIQTQSIYQVQNEFGPSGEQIWALPNDDRGLIRFVGNWAQSTSTQHGQFIGGQTAGDFCEITFYGTGLNLLTFISSGLSGTDARVTIDGGTEGSNFFGFTGNSVLASRNYAMNSILNLTSGLSLGIHTVKIRFVTVNNNLNIFGFEILNESTSIKTNTGSSYIGGRKTYTSAQDSSSFTGTFTNTFGVAGAKGGHVLIYQAADGTIKRDIQYTDATQLNLTSADHTNEEVTRKHHSREFGAGRSDDFSSLTTSTSDRSFALDDDTTNLVGASVTFQSTTNETCTIVADNGFLTLTFVGTGLDVIRADAANGGTVANHTAFVDGTSVGTIFATGAGSTIPTKVKVVSGLPYGTHTVKIQRITTGGTSNSCGVHSWVIYGPKKPTLPSGAIEIADYNLMATFVASTTAGAETMSTGVLRKSAFREMVYVGTGWVQNLPTTVELGAGGVNSPTSGDYFTYTFFGTGFDMRHRTNPSRSATITVSLNGTTLTSTNFPTATFSTYGGTAFTASTGNLNETGTDQNGSGFVVSGLPLATYTIKFLNGAASPLHINAFDIITPIYSYKSNLYADLENTLLVGSNAISDNRLNQPLKLQPAQKAWAQAIGVTSGPTTSSTIFVPVPDMSTAIKVSANGRLRLAFSSSQLNSGAANDTWFQFYVDGVAVGSEIKNQENNSNVYQPIANFCIVPVSAGVHKVDMYWRVGAGTSTLNAADRIMTVEEV